MAGKEKAASAPQAAMSTPASIPEGVAEHFKAVAPENDTAVKAAPVSEPEVESMTAKLFGHDLASQISDEQMRDRTTTFGSLVEIARLVKAQVDHGTPPPEGQLRALLDAVKAVL